MILLTVREFIGTGMGYCLGLITAALSWIRRARMFHPSGLCFQAKVQNLEGTPFSLAASALVRLSSAWWKKREWIDVLGIAIRFSHTPPNFEIPQPEDQDLLFATIRHPWTMPFAPLTTHFKDFLDNPYFAVTPFSYRQGSEVRFVKFSLQPLQKSLSGGTRGDKLNLAVQQKTAVFELRYRELGNSVATVIRTRPWTPVAQIELIHAVSLDQRKLRFNAFQNGCGIMPRGLIHHLRKGAYRMSQWARS